MKWGAQRVGRMGEVAYDTYAKAHVSGGVMRVPTLACGVTDGVVAPPRCGWCVACEWVWSATMWVMIGK